MYEGGVCFSCKENGEWMCPLGKMGDRSSLSPVHSREIACMKAKLRSSKPKKLYFLQFWTLVVQSAS